jgi:ATP-dependent DNA helicase PIF1
LYVLTTIISANKQGVSTSGTSRTIVIASTTGIAACNIGGVTIYIFSGMCVGVSTPEELVRGVMSNVHAKMRWKMVDILIIDEMSMMTGSFLENLSFVASKSCGDRRPFGGVHVVLYGDFSSYPLLT